VAKFDYVATGPDGRRTQGTQRAANRDAAEHELYQRNLRGVQITEKRGGPGSRGYSGVKREEVMHLSRQLSAFVSAGLPLIEAVHALGAESANSNLRKTMADVEEGLHRGDSLSSCFDRHPRIFPEYYRGILHSAELTGRLDQVLEQLAKYLERDLQARRRINQALAYPSIVAALALVTVVILAGFVLPRFRTFFASLNAQLPLAPRILLGIADFVLSRRGVAVLGGVLALVLIVLLALQTNAGRYAKDRILLSLPLIGSTVRYALVERFCRVLASMAAAGVPLPDALNVATESVHNRVFVRSLARVNQEMLEGHGLAVPLSRTRLFPGTAARMIRVGEETGSLETQLEVTARFYESELDYRLKRLTSLFEPAIIIGVGLVVGFVAVAMVSAMYGIFNQVQI
jgi:type IV pilus assembly protein PilC